MRLRGKAMAWAGASVLLPLPLRRAVKVRGSRRLRWSLTATAAAALVVAAGATATAAPGPDTVGRAPAMITAERATECAAPPQRVVRGGATSFVVRCSGATRITLLRQRGPGRVGLTQLGPGAARITFQAPRARAVTVLRLRAVGPERDTRFSQVIRSTNPMIRAIGDSVTSGFAYYGPLGRPMLITQAAACFTLTNPPDNRCSSNSGNGPNGGDRMYLRDYGFTNQVAYSARYARSVGSRPPALFQNLAVQGSTPPMWRSGGSLDEYTQRVVAAKPDIVVFTLGANPSLGYFLSGAGTQCASAPDFVKCAREGMDQFMPGRGVRQVILELLAAKGTSIVVSTYYDLFPIPAIKTYTPEQIRILVSMLEARVEAATRSAPGFGRRVFLMQPPTFEVGLAPGDERCDISAVPVDGPSNQSRASQVDLESKFPGRFCPGPAWITSQDTGIHPNRQGHKELESALASVIEDNRLLPDVVLSDRTPTPDPPAEGL